MKPITTFEELYVHELRDMYSAENQLVEALPKLADACESPELSSAIRAHLAQTKVHAERLRKILDMMEEDPEGETCDAMRGLIAENKEVEKDIEKGALRDAAFIVGCQKVEHYEIASYGSLRAFANLMGRYGDVDLLSMTEDEEMKADGKLNDIATSTVNEIALEMVTVS